MNKILYVIIATILFSAQMSCSKSYILELENKTTNNNDTSGDNDGGSDDNNMHDAVDLALSVKWATCNVGANAPEEYGNYYAWGEIQPKNNYTYENSVTYGKKMENIAGNPRYDAATANWGGGWRMPTRSEIKELLGNCTWKVTTQNGINGYRVTGPNGNSIFLPATGYCEQSIPPRNVGVTAGYWGSTPDEEYGGYYWEIEDSEAYVFEFSTAVNQYGENTESRSWGFAVRPVLE